MLTCLHLSNDHTCPAHHTHCIAIYWQAQCAAAAPPPQHSCCCVQRVFIKKIYVYKNVLLFIYFKLSGLLYKVIVYFNSDSV